MGDREASHRVQVQLVGLGVVEPPFLVPLLWPPSMSAPERFRLAASAPLLLAGYALRAAKLDAGARPLLPAFPLSHWQDRRCLLQSCIPICVSCKPLPALLELLDGGGCDRYVYCSAPR